MFSSSSYKVNDAFRYEEGSLFCEDVKVSTLVGKELGGESISTPVFVFSRRQICANVSNYRNALEEAKVPYILSYAMKANANPSILRIMRDNEVSLTLVSGNELLFALEVGFDPKTLVFNGSGKTDGEVELAITHDVLLNVDSAFNMKQTIRICEKLSKQGRILLRINPGVNPVSIDLFKLHKLGSNAHTHTHTISILYYYT